MRKRPPDGGIEHGPVVPERVVLQCRNDSSRDAYEHRQSTGKHAQMNRDRKGIPDHVHDRPALLRHRDAQVALGGVPHVTGELLVPRPVQTVLGVHVLQDLLGNPFLARERSSRNSLHQEERKKDDQNDHRYGPQNAANDQFGHETPTPCSAFPDTTRKATVERGMPARSARSVMKHETTYHTVLWKQRRIASGHREVRRWPPVQPAPPPSLWPDAIRRCFHRTV